MSAAAASSSVSEAATAAELRAFTDGFQARALQIIYEVIPTKIDSLQAILTKFRALPCDAPIFTPTGAETNASISRLMVPIKAEINDLLTLVDPLRMWVSLNIPRIQDQKGMAVSVKEDLVDMLHGSKVSALGLLESLTKFHVGRGKLISKKIKFPLGMADHTTAIAELDSKQYYMMINMVSDLKNNYALVYDMIIKNMEKIVRAQEDNYQNMY